MACTKGFSIVEFSESSCNRWSLDGRNKWSVDDHNE